MSKKTIKFITGNEAVVLAAKLAGAKFMSGYPITPATEILQIWAEYCSHDKTLKMIQAEDETSAGFNTIGALLSGTKSFTASAGPGHILMQDPLVMAEAMRLPFVGIMMMRGGPSTGTVIYGQQEVTLACFGGNGEGHRIVYSASGPQDLFDYTIKAFNNAWKYRFPTLVLGDGYQSKMATEVNINNNYKSYPSSTIFDKKNINIRNCFNFESELAETIEKNNIDYNKFSKEIVESEQYMTNDAKKIIIAHGIVATAAKEAINVLRNHGKNIGLFRPITLRPFDVLSLMKAIRNADEILIVESSFGQLERLVKANLSTGIKIKTIQKPALLISPEEIIKAL